MKGIKDQIGEPAMLEQLAEECTELAKAALKKARILRGENPTPITAEAADASLMEEYTDVVHCAKELGLEWSLGQMYSKHERWERRIKENEGDNFQGETEG